MTVGLVPRTRTKVHLFPENNCHLEDCTVSGGKMRIGKRAAGERPVSCV